MVNDFTFGLEQSDHLKRLILFMIFQKNGHLCSLVSKLSSKKPMHCEKWKRTLSNFKFETDWNFIFIIIFFLLTLQASWGIKVIKQIEWKIYSDILPLFPSRSVAFYETLLMLSWWQLQFISWKRQKVSLLNYAIAREIIVIDGSFKEGTETKQKRVVT